jgi:hypothetical protein
VVALDQRGPGPGEQRREEPFDELGVRVDEVGVDEADQVGRARPVPQGDDGAPHRLALARQHVDAGHRPLAAEHPCPGRRGVLRGAVGAPGVEDDEVVDQRDRALAQPGQPGDERTDRRLLVQGGQDDGDATAVLAGGEPGGEGHGLR